MPKTEWGIWIRSNVLEIIILILVLILVVNTFSKESVTKIEEKAEPIIKEQASESQKITEGKETEKPLENETIVQKQSTEQISQP